ncbi:MAG: M48 family metallopeptidase [Syntrophaceae bacterium]|nr:M48 family metallopeptidase [Syntrophaceae bacterium]
MVELNLLLFIFIAVFLLRSGTQVFLSLLNLSYLRKKAGRVPELFQDVIDEEKLRKISSYTVESDHFHLVAALANQGFFLLVILSGFLPWLVKMIDACEYGPIVEGLIFFGALSIIVNLFHIPFALYDTFVIEGRYGFNTMTFKLWILDLFKSIAISAILGGLVLWLLLNLVVHGGKAWWVWAWIGVGGFELLMLWIFPVVIAPLFNKFEPIEDKRLVHRIGSLMESVGLRVKGIFRMDAGKRSKHTNAYFTGIGRTKRIVLFDTLLASHPEEEVLAVLAHEIGHWKKKHLLKQIVLLEFLSLAVFYAASKFLGWPMPYQTFGFHQASPYIGLFLIGVFLSTIAYFAQPLESIISRGFECEADDFATDLMKTAEPMRSALKRLAADNLANLTPHPLYAWFYYSHPPLVERIGRLTSSKK